MDELKIEKKDSFWGKLISGFITKKLKNKGIDFSIRSLEAYSGDDGFTKVHIDADMKLTEVQIIKMMMS